MAQPIEQGHGFLRRTFLGSTPRKIFWLYILMIFVYSLIYWLTNSIEGKDNVGFLESVYFSVVTVTTLGYGDFNPSGTLGRVLAASEALLGIVLIGAFLNYIAEQRASKLERDRHLILIDQLLRSYGVFRDAITFQCINRIEKNKPDNQKEINITLENAHQYSEMKVFREYLFKDTDKKPGNIHLLLDRFKEEEDFRDIFLSELYILSKRIEFTLSNIHAKDNNSLNLLITFIEASSRAKFTSVHRVDTLPDYLTLITQDIMAGVPNSGPWRDYDLYLENIRKL
ncbi:potassium channel family protein [Microbulbifer sp. JMSA008]|uniref:potassium channel family protein n=1 Tax=Microbulbifer sp. JMSA008 TaxID=3243373 RepID=UPI004039F2BB